MDITLGYELLASLHAAAQDAANIHANADSHIHNLLCRAFDTSSPGDCTCGVPELLEAIDAALSGALLNEVKALTGLTDEDLEPVLALDVNGLQLFSAGWRTPYPHLKVLCELRDRAEAIPEAEPERRRAALLAPCDGQPDTLRALLAAIAPEPPVIPEPRSRPAPRKRAATRRPVTDVA